MLSSSILDLSYVSELAGSDKHYMYDIINIFIDTNNEGIDKLDKLVQTEASYEDIQRQAHYLKSSASIIKVKDNHEHLVRIDAMMKIAIKEKQTANMDEVKTRIALLKANYQEALPFLNEELTKYK
ncbi:MAG: hypothetical protein EBX41_03455 [Chitinophagia bacterium]|nr:hypothetical protein [Chitinophagia bacterium]